MAQSVAVVRATLTATSGGTTDFASTGLGTPAAAMFVYGNSTSASNPRPSASLGIGFWDGTDARCINWFGADAAATSNTTRTASETQVIRLGANSLVPMGYTAANITDGVRLTMATDNTSDQHFAEAHLWAGVSAKVGTITPNATQDGTTESISLGFAPKIILFLAGHQTGASDNFNDARGSWGFAEINGAHGCFALHWDDNQAAETAAQQISATRCAGVTTSYFGEVTTWGADTFTLTTRDATNAGGQVMYFLALGGDVSYDTFTFDSRTTTGDTVVPTDVAPDSVILCLTTNSAVGLATDSGANGVAIGMADDSGEFSHNTSVEDAADPTNANSAAQAAQAIDLDSSAAGSRTDLLDGTVALNASDVTLTYSVVDGTARKCFGIAFGPSNGGGAAPTVTRRFLTLGCGA